MDSIRDICDNIGLDGAVCFVYGEQFLEYEGNRVRKWWTLWCECLCDSFNVYARQS